MGRRALGSLVPQTERSRDDDRASARAARCPRRRAACPHRIDRRIATPSSGSNRSRSASRCVSSSRRWWSLRVRTSTTWSRAESSRSLSVMRRSTSWTSRTCDSPSTKNGGPSPVDHRVPRPQVSLDRDRNLAAHPKGRTQGRLEPREEVQLGRIADRLASRVELHVAAQTQRPCGPADLRRGRAPRPRSAQAGPTGTVDRPAARAAVAWLTPAPIRPSRSSWRWRRRARRASASPSEAGVSRAAMGPVWCARLSVTCAHGSDHMLSVQRSIDAADPQATARRLTHGVSTSTCHWWRRTVASGSRLSPASGCVRAR